MFSLLDLAAILLTLSALFGWLNHKFVPLPHTIGLLVMSVVTSIILVTIDLMFPRQHLFDSLTTALLQIDFSSTVMNGMLGFLLFAGALISPTDPVAVLSVLRNVNVPANLEVEMQGAGP